MPSAAATTPAATTAPSTSLAFLPRSTSKKFPFKLHDTLAYAEKHGLEHVVSWLPGGKGFAVHDHQAFCRHVLKATFAHSNFKSFEKQLNNWGFERDTSSESNKVGGSKAYSNPNFIRGRKSLCQAMTSKSTLKKAQEAISSTGVTSTIRSIGAITNPTNHSKARSPRRFSLLQEDQQEEATSAATAHVVAMARQRHAMVTAALAAAVLNNRAHQRRSETKNNMLNQHPVMTKSQLAAAGRSLLQARIAAAASMPLMAVPQHRQRQQQQPTAPPAPAANSAVLEELNWLMLAASRRRKMLESQILLQHVENRQKEQQADGLQRQLSEALQESNAQHAEQVAALLSLRHRGC